jgi:hypothetical protein
MIRPGVGKNMDDNSTKKSSTGAPYQYRRSIANVLKILGITAAMTLATVVGTRLLDLVFLAGH